MTALDALIKEGRELLGKATAGPWQLNVSNIDDWEIIYTEAIRGCYGESRVNIGKTFQIVGDGKFIAFARNNLARFLDEIESMQVRVGFFAAAEKCAQENAKLRVELEAGKIQWAAIKENADRACAENDKLRAAFEHAIAQTNSYTMRSILGAALPERKP